MIRDEQPRISIDGFGPLPVRRPVDAAGLGELVREAVATRQGVYPVGGATMLDLGLTPTKPGFAVDTTALAAVVDYPSRDMTITVQAGITMAALRSTLSAQGQWLPIDVPLPERSTLGGGVAANLSGPRRLGYGTLRDYILGIRFVTDAGVEVKAGGRVVKNVAGYDLMKLQTGALGTLGVITELTLKVRPMPEASGIVVVGCDEANITGLLELLHSSRSRPVAVELLSHPARQKLGIGDLSQPWAVLVGFEEKAITRDWQLATLRDELAEFGAAVGREFLGEAALSLWSALTALQQGSGSGMTFRATVLPSAVGTFVREAAALAPDLSIHAHALNGVVWVHAGEGDESAAASLCTQLARLAERSGGNVTVRHCQPEWKQSLAIWGKPGTDRELMRHLKRTLDPMDVFNPGRMFGHAD